MVVTVYRTISSASIRRVGIEWHAICPAFVDYLSIGGSEPSDAVDGAFENRGRVHTAITGSLDCKLSHWLRFGSSSPHTAGKETCRE
jgi:hypothetical protein